MAKRSNKGQFKEGNTKGFKKGQSGNPKGRPKKYYKRFQQDNDLEGYSQAQIREVYALVAEMTEKQIDTIIKDKDADILFQCIGRAFQKAKAKGDFKAIKDIVELITGKAITKVAQTNADGDDVLSFLLPVGLDQPKQPTKTTARKPRRKSTAKKK